VVAIGFNNNLDGCSGFIRSLREDLLGLHGITCRARTIPAWNALPQLVAEADSLDTFKQRLSRHQQF